jgi:hypothetical protein
LVGPVDGYSVDSESDTPIELAKYSLDPIQVLPQSFYCKSRDQMFTLNFKEENHDQKKNFVTVIVTVVVLAVLTTVPTIVFGMIYLMTGKISAIDLAYDTVVIEVPMVSKTFTVGGRLADEAVLLKNNQTAGLSDFSVGEQVTVKWHSTPQGHVIDRLVAK